MSIMAVAIPIKPGKTDAWRKWTDELKGPRQREYASSRNRVGLRERNFLQRSPQGDLAIVILEGDDPERAFSKMMQASDPFTSWFLDQVKDIHGVDLANGGMTLPTLVVDSEAALVAAG